MRIEELRKLHQTRPFIPFRIHLADGRAIPVGHPELLALSPTGRSAVVYLPEDSFEVVDIPLITSLQVGNGAPRTRRKRK
jgi:hypothetical protein